jgi:dTDP-4-dehydrorhamnose 3,5-epimerase
MSKIKTFPMEGIKIFELNRIVDERGSFTEIMRNDWTELFGDEQIKQSNLSVSYPGMIRAWHRHARGQIDYYVVIKGTVKISVYDNDKQSKTFGHLTEIVSSSEKLQVVRVPGHYWHGIKTLGTETSMLVYFINNLYDYENTDEERSPWNNPEIIDPVTKSPFDWNKLPHK